MDISNGASSLVTIDNERFARVMAIVWSFNNLLCKQTNIDDR